MKVKCISDRLNHVHFATLSDGSKKAIRIKKGDVFEVKSIPDMWEGMVVAVETAAKDDTKAAVVNPENGGPKTEAKKSS